MIKYFHLNSIGAFLLPQIILAGMVIEENAKAVFSINNSIRPAIYKISAREFSEPDAMAKLDFLKSVGFSYLLKSDTGKVKLYKNDSTGQFLAYNRENSEYYYDNPKIGGFTENERLDTNRMRLVADQYLGNIMGNDAKNFRFSHTILRYMGSRDINGGIPFLDQAAFRYLRVLDGRLVKGMTSHVIIRLGKNCQLAHFQINDKKLEKVHYLDQEIKNSAMVKYLADHIASKEHTKTEDGRDIPINKTIVEKGCESYFAKEHGSLEFLEPCMTFFSTDSLLDKTVLQREFHLTVDAAMIGNVSTEDKIEFEKRSKK